MGGMGRMINGSYAELTLVPATNVMKVATDLSWEEFAVIPESYATAWTCLYGNLQIEKGQTLLLRGATSALGQAALNIAANAGLDVIATTRNKARFEKLLGLGAKRVEIEGPGAFQATTGGKEGGCCAGPCRQQYTSRFDCHSTSAWTYLLGRLARWSRSGEGLQPIATDGQRNTL